MIKFWDDRCVSVIPNTGEIIPFGSNERIKELAAERDRLREALKEIAKFADSEYEKRIPAPSCVEFSTVKRYAEKALKGAGECRK